MGTHLPESLRLPWQLKPTSSASAGVEILKDGRKKFWIKHDLLRTSAQFILLEFSGNAKQKGPVSGSNPTHRAIG